MTLSAPSRKEVRQQLVDVLSGRVSREEAASWANPWVIAPDPVVEDRVVWTALKELSGVDLRVNATDYLHGEADIHEWLDRVENAIEHDDGE